MRQPLATSTSAGGARTTTAMAGSRSELCFAASSCGLHTRCHILFAAVALVSCCSSLPQSHKDRAVHPCCRVRLTRPARMYMAGHVVQWLVGASGNDGGPLALHTAAGTAVIAADYQPSLSAWLLLMLLLLLSLSVPAVQGGGCMQIFGAVGCPLSDTAFQAVCQPGC